MELIADSVGFFIPVGQLEEEQERRKISSYLLRLNTESHDFGALTEARMCVCYC